MGPAHHLADHGSDVVADLPGVGQNLQDHPAAGPILTSPDGSLFGADAPQHILSFLVRGKGPLTSNVAEAGAFLRTDHAGEAPDIQLHFAPVMFLDEGLTEPPGHGMTLSVCLLRPRLA